MSEKPTTAPGRIVPRSDEIVRLRTNMGWSAEDLAQKAGISARTISSIENGRPAYAVTLGNIATALQVSVAQIRADHVETPKKENTLVDDGRFRVELHASWEFNKFDETDELESLIHRLMQLAALSSSVEFRRLWEGSIVIEIELTQDDFHKLLLAFAYSKLDPLKIESIVSKDSVVFPSPGLKRSKFRALPTPELLDLLTFTKHFGEGYDEYTKKPGVPDLSDSDADIMTDIDLLDNDKD